jgi:hypothetical protein
MLSFLSKKFNERPNNDFILLYYLYKTIFFIVIVTLIY